MVVVSKVPVIGASELITRLGQPPKNKTQHNPFDLLLLEDRRRNCIPLNVMEEAKLQALHDSLSRIRGRKGLGTGGSQFSWQKATAAGDGQNRLPTNALYNHFVPEGSYDPNNKAAIGDGRTIKRDFSDCVNQSDDDDQKEGISKEERKRRRKEEKKTAKLEAKRQAKLEEKRRLKRQAKTINVDASSPPSVASITMNSNDAKDTNTATVSDDASAQELEESNDKRKMKKEKKSKKQKGKKDDGGDNKDLVEAGKPDVKAKKRTLEFDAVSDDPTPTKEKKSKKKSKKTKSSSS
jgi:hypothetical protein